MKLTHHSRAGRRRAIGLVAAAAAGGLLLSACSTSDDGTAPTTDEGSAPATGDAVPAAEQVLRFGFSSEPPRPTTFGGTASTVSYQLYGLIHQGVMTYDGDGEVVPGLAESAEQVDPLTYEFTLRDGLTFHDGTPVTAEDVSSSLSWYANPEHSARSYPGMRYIDTIDVASDTELTITLSSANLSFLEYLADPSAFVVPASELDPDVEATIGAGPYVLESWDEGVGLTLTKFDGYYAADDVSLDTVEVSFYPDATARVNALLSGDVDFIDYVPWESYAQLESAGFVVDGEVGVFQSAFFNVVDGPFSDPLVREAVAYAVNRDNATDAAFFGNGISLYGVPGSGGSGENLWEYDPDKARELLAEAGYADGGPEVHLAANSTYVFLQDLALSVQADLEAVGFTVELTSPDWATFTEQALAGEYDVMVQGNIGNVEDPAAWLPRLVQQPAEANKSFGYSNAELDAALAAALAAEDEASKQAALDEAYAIIQTDVPFATINQRMQAYAYTDAVTGFEVMTGFRQPYSVNNLTDVVIAD